VTTWSRPGAGSLDGSRGVGRVDVQFGATATISNADDAGLHALVGSVSLTSSGHVHRQRTSNVELAYSSAVIARGDSILDAEGDGSMSPTLIRHARSRPCSSSPKASCATPRDDDHRPDCQLRTRGFAVHSAERHRQPEQQTQARQAPERARLSREPLRDAGEAGVTGGRRPGRNA
jgi:hypothetical protein